MALFGPAHAGKSTLAGLFVYRNDPSRHEKNIAQAQNQLTVDFDPAQALAYLVDVSTDERRRLGTSTRLGNSRRLHIKRGFFSREPTDMAQTEIDIIDTPGAEHNRNERINGIFYADLGLFLIELRTASKGLTNSDGTDLRSAISALASWIALRQNDPLILVLTKSDMESFHEDIYQSASSYLASLLPKSIAPPCIPISIDVKARTSNNIFPSDSRPEWYRGKTLVESILDIQPHLPNSLLAHPASMSIATAKERPGMGTIYFGKVLRGKIRVGDKVRLLPVVPNKNGRDQISGTVRSIERSGDSTLVTDLQEGEMGGVIFGHASDRRVEIEPTSMVLAETVTYKQGRYFRLSIHSLPPWLRMLSHIQIVWLGRCHSAKVFAVRKGEETSEVGILLQQKCNVVAPTDHVGRFVFSRLHLSHDDDTATFLPAELLGVHSIMGIRIDSPVLCHAYMNRDRDARLNQSGSIGKDSGNIVPLEDSALDRVMTHLSRVADREISNLSGESLEEMVKILVEPEGEI